MKAMRWGWGWGGGGNLVCVVDYRIYKWIHFALQRLAPIGQRRNIPIHSKDAAYIYIVLMYTWLPIYASARVLIGNVPLFSHPTNWNKDYYFQGIDRKNIRWIWVKTHTCIFRKMLLKCRCMISVDQVTSFKMADILMNIVAIQGIHEARFAPMCQQPFINSNWIR